MNANYQFIKKNVWFIVAITIFFTVTCLSKIKKIKMKNGCIQSVEKLISTEVKNWRGFDNNCLVKDVFELLKPANSGSAKGFLGSKSMAYSTVLCSHPLFKQPLRVWFKNDSVVRIDSFFPDININITNFQVAAGNPDKKEDYFFGEVIFKSGEWIYANKGMTAYLNGDLDRVIQISIYQPVSLNKYDEEIKTVLKYREFDY
jgi:hypothetical protein